MKKEWLIRTKNNHILGPVSIKKVKELYDNGSIKAEDEVSCGNGYWFYVREKDLVDKYLNNEIRQGFNPVSEADTVLAKPKEEVQAVVIDEESGTALPADSDLEYPDMGMDMDDLPADEPENPATSEEDEIAQKEEILNELRSQSEQEDVQMDEDTVSNNVLAMHREEESAATPKQKHVDPLAKKREKIESLKATREKVHNSFLSQNVLYIIVGTLFILALLGFYYRKTLVKEFINARIDIISPVYAQVIPSAVKKK